MTNYIEYKLSLTENQKKEILHAITKKQGVTVRLGKTQFQNGDFPVLLTQSQVNKILKAKQNGTGVDLDLSSAQIKKLSKHGGILPLIPIFAGITALGSLAGVPVGIAKTVLEKKAKDKEIEELVRHNKEMENALKSESGVNGTGLFLSKRPSGSGIKAYKSRNGTGLFLGKRQPV
jgi:hypothetical protein